ncbi:MAG TPA: hypothetical protein VF783_24480 [Terriglobales bacterium]
MALPDVCSNGSGNSGTKTKIETTYSYDQAGRMLEEGLGADMQMRYE